MSTAAVPSSASSRGFAGALADVDAAVAELGDQPLWAMDNAALLASLAALTATQSRLDAIRLTVIAEAEERGAATDAGAPSTSAWLRGALRLAPGAAATQSRLASRLADPAYTPTARAMSSGAISTGHATVIARTLESLPDSIDASAFAEAQASLLEHAAILDPTQLRNVAQHLRAVLDPASLDELARREFEQAEHRTLTLSPAGDGWVLVRGQLDTEGAAQLRAAIGVLAAPKATTELGPDPRPAAQRRADALVELARRALAKGDLPTMHGGQRPTIVVTTTLETLRDHIGAATLTTGEALTPAASRRIACDAGIIPAVLGGASQPLDLGRSTRTISPALYRALVIRDKCCAFPLCNRPPEWTEAHHIKHWADGGRTALTNLVLLCAHHHQVVHVQGWGIVIDDSGRPEFTQPGSNGRPEP